MTNRTWTITFRGHTVTYDQDYDVPNGNVGERGTTMMRSLDVFLDGLRKMEEGGAEIVVGTRV